MRAHLIVGLTIFSLGNCLAAEAIVADADTLVVQGAAHQLDGIEAPESDQICLDKNGSPWTCGIEARDQLRKFIAGREVRCSGKQSDPVYRNRRISVCTVEGESTSLNEWLVREGWALNLEPYAKGRFKKAEEEARSGNRGLWSGCFASPQELLSRQRDEGRLLGSLCGRLKAQEARELLFPERPNMPPGCAIKGRYAMRAHFTGHRGVYHLEGCRSYDRLKLPERWFCSETEAQAEGFRRAFNCKGPKS